jgi:DNA-binding CsgD family transcriptional regulator
VLAGLTRSERLVVGLVARGWTNREIADELSLRPKTVEWTLTKVYRKLALRSRTELALEVARSNPGISLDAQPEANPAMAHAQGGSLAAMHRSPEFDSDVIGGVLDVVDDRGGEGKFAGARGRIASNFLLSDTGELTDNQFGLIFVGPSVPQQPARRNPERGRFR